MSLFNADLIRKIKKALRKKRLTTGELILVTSQDSIVVCRHLDYLVTQNEIARHINVDRDLKINISYSLT